MAWNPRLRKARRSLDLRFRVYQPASEHQAPAKGWIRAIRSAIGLSAEHLGASLGIRSQSIDDLEKSEAAGRITLDALRRAGAAMDCTLVYALVPNNSLESLVRRKAETLARAAIAHVDHTMALEDQPVAAPLQQQIDDYIAEHLSERDLWRQQ